MAISFGWIYQKLLCWPNYLQKMDEVMNFTDKERVLCFHGPLMYEAKVFIK